VPFFSIGTGVPICPELFLISDLAEIIEKIKRPKMAFWPKFWRGIPSILARIMCSIGTGIPPGLRIHSRQTKIACFRQKRTGEQEIGGRGKVTDVVLKDFLENFC